MPVPRRRGDMEAEAVVEEPAPLAGESDRSDGVAELYRREYAPMVRLAHLITGSNEVAEDIVQESFVKMYGKWDRAEQPGAYLRMIVVNGCRTWHRRRRLERERMPRPVAEAVEPQARELLDALAGLGVRQRTALVLRFYGDLSEADVARALGCRPGTAKSLVHPGPSGAGEGDRAVKGPVEERLRRALTQQAETTTTSPDGWRRIQARRAGPGRPAFEPWTVLAPAAVVTVLVLVLVVAVAGSGNDRALRVTGDAGRLYLKPTGVEPRFRPVGAGYREGGEPWSFRAFGRRGADGVTLDASVVVAMPSVGVLDSIVVTFLPTPLRAAGRDITTATDPFGRRILDWTQTDGRTVGVVTHGLSEGEVVSVAESLLAGDAATAAPVLPAGFTALDSRAVPGGTSEATQTWQADDGDSFTLSVADEPGATLDRLAWSLPGGRAARVRGTTALYRAGHTGYLGWIERPGTVVTLRGTGLTEQELISIAEGVRPIDDSVWREMINRPDGSLAAGPPQGAVGPPPQIGPPPGAAPSPSAWLGFLPVRGRDAPPCRTIQELWLAEIRAGQEVACYKISGPALNAGDVASAAVRQDRATATWTVELTLTDAGNARLAALFRDVGAGGQYAVIVDGRLVAVPRFDVSPPATGLITGLDEGTARGIADRLPR